MTTLDFTKPVQTRDGCRVLILLADSRVIVGFVEGSAYVHWWRHDGTSRWGNGDCPEDLINVPDTGEIVIETVEQRITRAVKEAVLAEREACAALADIPADSPVRRIESAYHEGFNDAHDAIWKEINKRNEQ